MVARPGAGDRALADCGPPRGRAVRGVSGPHSQLGWGRAGCVLRGWRGPHTWGGPMCRSRGTGSSSRGFQDRQSPVQLLGHQTGRGWRGGQGGGHSLSRRKGGPPGRRGQSPASAPRPRDSSSPSASVQGVQRPRGPRKGGGTVWGEGRGAEAPSPPNLKARRSQRPQCPGGEEGGHPRLPGAGLGQAGSFRASKNKRETEAPGPPCAEGPRPGGRLDFLGFPANLVIVVNADGDEKEAARQEQQGPRGHEARLGQRGSDHCGRKAGRSQRSEEGCASPW